MATYYVATDGSDSANGSSSSAWRTINHALSAGLRPGDEVVVRSGVYNESLSINVGGSAAAQITLRSEVPHGAQIKAPSGSWNAVSVNANYVTVQGFDISGGNGDGIEGNSVHHVRIVGNEIHGNGESGIQFNGSEFLLIEGNETWGNAASGWFSGISVYQNRNITGDTTTEGFRTIIRNNVSHDNVTKSGAHTDGNGIIIDDFQSTQTSGHPNYTYPTLVEGNLVYQNGGKGVQVTWSDYVTVRNNTAYHNNQDQQNTGTWRGELSNAQSSHNTWVNNIAVSDPRVNSNNTAIDNTSYGGYVNQSVVWANNITYTGTAGVAGVKTDGGNAMPSTANGNRLGVDPGFVAAGSNFHLSTGSAAVNAGTAAYGVAANDLDGDARTNGAVDIGYDEQSGGTSTQPPTTTNGAPYNLSISNASIAETAKAGTLVGKLSAVDPDGDTVTFSVSGDTRFTVNASGEVVVAQGASLSVNGNQQVGLTVLANDGHGHVVAAGLQLTILDTVAGVTLTGTTGSDLLQGGTGHDSLLGLRGNDTLVGNAGNDTLSGGSGTDRMVGGTGDDEYIVDRASDVVVEAANGGRDVVTSSVSVQLAANVEELKLVGTSMLHGTGNELGNIISGNSSGNTLQGMAGDDVIWAGRGQDMVFGGDGNDWMSAGRGHDHLTGGAGADSFYFASGWADDEVMDFTDNVDTIVLKSDLWGGGAKTGAEMLSYAKLVGTDAIFDFGNGDVLTVHGVRSLATLVDDLAWN